MSASGFYNASPDGRRAVDMPEAIVDYNHLTFYWDKFGIRPHEIEQYDPRWLEEMLIVNNAKVEADNARMERNK